MIRSGLIMRISAALSAFVFTFISAAILISPASAESVRVMLVMGDAVSSGKMLPDRAGGSFGGLLAAELGIKSGDYRNVAADTADSGDLLESLPLHSAYIERADFIVISIGIDDIMPYIGGALESMVGGEVTYSEFLSLVSVPGFADRLNAAIDHTAIFGATTAFSVNLRNIILKIKEYSPGCGIVLLSLYNPVDGIPELAELKSAFEITVRAVNQSIESAASEYDCGVINLAAAFAGGAGRMTNITSLDVSPSAAGHRVIADLIKEYAANLPELPDLSESGVTTGGAPETNPPGSEGEVTTTAGDLWVVPTPRDSHIWIYVLIAAAVAGGGIVVALLRIKQKK